MAAAHEQAGRRTTGMLLLAAALVGAGIAWREGEFSYWGLPMVLLGWALVVAVAWRGVLPAAPTRRQLLALAAFVLASALLLRVERYMHAGDRIGWIQIGFALTAAAAAATALPWVAASVTRSRAAAGVALGLAAVTGVVTVVVVDDPDIDVWYLLQQSSDGLLRGDNMYQQRWADSNGLQETYPYLPVTTVLLAPFRWLLGDVRYALLLASLLTVLVAQRLGAPRRVAALLPLLVVVQPKWPFLIDQSWTEPLLLLFLAIAVLALDLERPVVAVVAVGAALACKQHVVLLLPVLAMWPGFGWRRALLSGVGAGVSVLPWFLWSPSAFWEDAVEANLGLGVLERALCIPSLLSRGGVTVSFLFMLAMLGAAYVVIWRRVPRSTAGLCIASALVLLTLDVANKQSFFNHYSLPLGVLVLALVAAGDERSEHRERHERVQRAR